MMKSFVLAILLCTSVANVASAYDRRCPEGPNDRYDERAHKCIRGAGSVQGGGHFSVQGGGSGYGHQTGGAQQAGMVPVTSWFPNRALLELDPSTVSWKCTPDGKRLPDNTPLGANVGICTGTPRN